MVTNGQDEYMVISQATLGECQVAVCPHTDNKVLLQLSRIKAEPAGPLGLGGARVEHQG